MDSDTNARIGDWLQTYTGRRFWPMDPRPEEVDREDIRWSLSRICRYLGHSEGFYSVAQHSVLVSHEVHPGLAIHGLLHDAAEAYLCDLPRPLKRSLPSELLRWYVTAEKRVLAAIYQHFSLLMPSEQDQIEIHRADNVLLATECRDVMGGERGGAWHLEESPRASLQQIRCWSPERSRQEFRSRLSVLLVNAS